VVNAAGVAGVNLPNLAARSYDVQYSDGVILRATLTADGGGLVGRTVTFAVNGLAAGSAITDGDGVATVGYVINLGAGIYTITADFAGDGIYIPMSGQGDLSVTHEDAYQTYTGDLVANGGPFALQVTLTQAADGSPGDITLAGTVEFTLTRLSDGVVQGVYSGLINGAGQASSLIGALPADAYSLTVHLLVNEPDD